MGASGTMWRPGDAPETHPLWEQQVLLERGMLREGADKVRDQVATAVDRKAMSRLGPVRALLDEWLPIVANGVTEWIADARKGRGAHPVALRFLEGLDPYVVALVGLRELLDAITIERTYVVSLVESIGRTLEHEAKIIKWEREDPDLFYRVGKMLDHDKATPDHRKRVNLNRFNHHMQAGTFGFDWQDRGKDAQYRVGVAVLDIIIRYTKWFKVDDDPAFVAPPKSAPFTNPRKVIQAREELVDHLAQSFRHAELTHPKFKPMLMPPKRWDGIRRGGYYTPYVPAPALVRFKASTETQQEFASDEYDAIDMPDIYVALHALQETPWAVNRRVLEVAKAAWARDEDRGNGAGIGGLPRIGEEQEPPRSGAHEAFLAKRHIAQARHRAYRGASPKNEPVPSKKLAEEMRRWRRMAKAVKGRNARRVGHGRGATQIIQTAEEFQDAGAFYFPHKLDFRGRVYPIPSGLQPQGNDLARGLLQFADGIPITTENVGRRWLTIHLANCWGNDKVSFDDRVAWAEEREEVWRRVAADPLGNLDDWSEADKPWQTLAAIFEWVGFLEHGWGYVSYLPVMVDGSCNGIQHLSALTRDEVAGKFVNLVPTNRPQDIYQEVADRLLGRIKASPDGAHLSYWLRFVDETGRLPRSLTKRQTMVLPYGGTQDSCFEYSREWLDDRDPAPDNMTPEQFSERMAHLRFLVGHLWSVLNEVVSGGMVVMKWLRKCAKAVAACNQPILWVGPAGFLVRHFYGTVVHKTIETKLDGQRYKLRRAEYTSETDPKKQAAGVAPNFVHSLDASALVICTKLCLARGIDRLTTVHDAYGTHAGKVWLMNRLIRASFVEVHSRSPLEAFRRTCCQVLSDALRAEGQGLIQAAEEADRRLPALPAMGNLDLSGVEQSDYFFA